MNKVDTLKAIAVMQAYCHGKIIQARSTTGEWFDLGCEPDWIWSQQYRIKPEPMEIEVWVNPSGKIGRIKEPVEVHSQNDGWTIKKFREVTEG